MTGVDECVGAWSSVHKDVREGSGGSIFYRVERTSFSLVSWCWSRDL